MCFLFLSFLGDEQLNIINITQLERDSILVCYESKSFHLHLLLTLQNTFLSIIMPMPHGSDKTLEKNHNEIRHFLFVPHGSDKSWPIIKQITYEKITI